VAEQRLQHPKVRPAFEQMSGERMAQHVRAELRRIEPGARGQRLQELE